MKVIETDQGLEYAWPFDSPIRPGDWIAVPPFPWSRSDFSRVHVAKVKNRADNGYALKDAIRRIEITELIDEETARLAEHLEYAAKHRWSSSVAALIPDASELATLPAQRRRRRLVETNAAVGQLLANLERDQAKTAKAQAKAAAIREEMATHWQELTRLRYKLNALKTDLGPAPPDARLEELMAIRAKTPCGRPTRLGEPCRALLVDGLAPACSLHRTAEEKELLELLHVELGL